MQRDSLEEYIEEVKPLVSPSQYVLTKSSHGRKVSPWCRNQCVVPCLVISVLALLSCFYVDKEAVVDLGNRSRSFIRKSGDSTLLNSTAEELHASEINNSSGNVTADLNASNGKRHYDEAKKSTKLNLTISDDRNFFQENEDRFHNSTTEKEYVSKTDGQSSVPTKKVDDHFTDQKMDGQSGDPSNEPLEVETYKDHLVLHLGPQKTGSTTLQTAWYMPQGLSQDLKKDNYRYAFINPRAGYFNCDISENGGYVDCEPSKQLKTLISLAKSSSQNLLLSDENLDSRFIHPLNMAIDRKHWHVTVIVVYRRIHEWLVSWYNQINKTTNKDIHGNVLFDDYGQPYRMNHKWWPDQGGTEIPSFSDWYKKFTMYFDRSDLISKHRSVELVNDYSPVFDEIVVHNMHQDGDLVTNFMCDSLPSAPHCCERLKKGALKIPRENASIDLDHDIIAVEARNRGLLQKSLSRPEVQDAVSQFIHRTGKKVPRKCDHEMIEEIRGWLIGSEQEMFRDQWTEKKSSDLEDIFDVYVEKGKLCDVDLNRTFEDEAWLQFFGSLDNRPSLTLHVGPQKTGSTTLQQAWASPKELGDFLQQDHFSYAKITPEKGMFECQVESGKAYSSCQTTQELHGMLTKAREKGQHVLLSDENLDETYARSLRAAIKDSEFNTKVVVVYRRIHEWLFSWYNQINKSTNLDANGNYLVDENGHIYREEHKYFPEEGGRTIPSFGDWYRKFTGKWNSSDLALNHPSIHFVNVYKPLFRRVEIFNMHQNGDFVTNFMCQMIPEAKQSCIALKTGTDVAVENVSVKLDYDIIAVAAYEAGIVRKDITRTILRAAVSFFVEKTGKPIPRTCDEGILQEIKNWLLDSERIVFEDNWDSENESNLENIFDEYRNTGLLCDIDVDRVIGDEEWIRFFKALDQLDLEPLHGYNKKGFSDNGSTDKKPFLTLHIGPQETGSSALQFAWDTLGSELDQDEYSYRHISPEEHDFICDVGRWGGFTNCKASDQLLSLIEETHRAGRNLLLSDENLDERFAQPLRDAIDDSMWNVTVAVTYRRIHEWLVSWYSEINKTTNVDTKGNVLIDDDGNPYRQEHRYWPDQGGVHIPSFSAWYLEYTHDWGPSELVGKHRSVEFYHLYAPLFDNVIFYDMHKEGDFVTNFICDVIPRADHTCLKLKNNKIQLPPENPSVTLDHDILAVYAYDKGYVDKSLSRPKVVAAIGQYVKESNKILPRSCHPGTSKQIYDWLLATEEEMFPDSWSSTRQEELAESFKTFFRKGVMCDVDTEEVLRDQDWIDFFQSLLEK
ncbi:hypothetical protein IV203_037316 [Nitzschia inconspicua]|uniref:Uncharacterized protein n=1 Tax=Nitzschia inconspicua TaxID=303405 RepID=A0A9K3PB83_9STRA|nr:hypothetical protein IV203_006350 [Nitzschia inconspicua]KAG7364114.1 hypothetical protein IV203_037316 [Nitzschia inconspicua]